MANNLRSQVYKHISISPSLLRAQFKPLKPAVRLVVHHRTITTTTDPSKMTTYNITITSDIVCPWCYIGHTRLTRAITNHKRTNPDDKFNLKYLPFYLNPPPKFSPSSPAFPIESKPRQEYYANKFGNERATQIFSMLNQVASSEGLNFKSGGMTGQSRNGHRLVHYAQNHGGEQAQNDVMLGLWRRYFEQEVDITKLDILVETGVEAGLGSKQEIEEYLVSGKDGEEVDQLADDARDKDINGVPHYVIQDLWGISGAQEPQAFEALFKRYKDMEAKGSIGHNGTTPGKGQAC